MPEQNDYIKLGKVLGKNHQSSSMNIAEGLSGSGVEDRLTRKISKAPRGTLSKSLILPPTTSVLDWLLQRNRTSKMGIYTYICIIYIICIKFVMQHIKI